MSMMDDDACECLKSELDLFSNHAYQLSINESRYEKYYPITSLTALGPIEFKIVSGDEDYLDLQNSFLYVKCRLLNGDGSALAAADGANDPADGSICYPINYFFATQFKSVEVSLNNKQVSGSDVLYSQKAYLEALLSYGHSKQEQLQCALFAKDVGEFETVANLWKEACTNTGARARFLATQYSKPFEMWGRVHSELFAQPKLMLSKMDMRIKFHRHAPEFALIAKTDTKRYQISIEQAIMYVCKKTVSSSVREAHELALLKTNAKYPVRKIDMKYFTRGPQQTDLSEPNLVHGILPRRVVIALASSEATSGHLAKSPLNFQHFKVTTLKLRQNGVPVPFEELEMNFDDDLYSRGYLTLFQGTGRLFTDSYISIDQKDYKKGHAIYSFDLSADMSEKNASVAKEGKLSLELKLGEAPTEAVAIIVYLERDACIEIDGDRNVHYE